MLNFHWLRINVWNTFSFNDSKSSKYAQFSHSDFCCFYQCYTNGLPIQRFNKYLIVFHATIHTPSIKGNTIQHIPDAYADTEKNN